MAVDLKHTSSYIVDDWCIPVWRGLASVRYGESLQTSTKSAAQQHTPVTKCKG